MSVSHILRAKGRDVITARSHDSVESVVNHLAVHKIGAVVIVDDAGAIEGIVSERDIVRQLAVDGAKLLQKTVDQIMTRNVHTCTDGDSEQELMTLMTTRRIRHLPVVHKGRLHGMISIGDVVKNRIESIEREAEEMKTYIATAG